MSERVKKILLAGEGGQGVQSVAQILALAANNEGRQSIYLPNFGTEQRGGVSLAYVQVGGQKAIGAPKFFDANIVVALSSRSIERIFSNIGVGTSFVYDNSLIAISEQDRLAAGSRLIEINPEGLDLNSKDREVMRRLPDAKISLGVPATEVAKTDFHPRVFNVIVLGLVIGATRVVDPSAVKQALDKTFGKKFENHPELRALNFNALEQGMEYARVICEE